MGLNEELLKRKRKGRKRKEEKEDTKRKEELEEGSGKLGAVWSFYASEKSLRAKMELHL